MEPPAHRVDTFLAHTPSPPLPQLVATWSEGEPDPEDVLRAAGVPARSGAVQFLTQEQRAALVEELEARGGGRPPREHVKRRSRIKEDAA